MWAPLLLACALATVALTAAVDGGTLPGLSDASSSSDAQQRAEAADRPAGTSTTARTTAGSSSPAVTVAVPPTSPAPTAPPAPTTSAPASQPGTPEPAPGTTAEPPASAETPAPVLTPPPAAALPPAPGPEDEVLSLVNAERATAGCAPVIADAGLAAVARAHSADMRDRNFFSHDNPDGLDPFERAAAAGLDARAENIAFGQPDAAAVMAAWLGSSGHRETIRDCSLRTLGVGEATGPGGPWWTQLFG